MSWENIIKISENEKDDFKRYGQPEWDEGMKNIKDNKMERRVATFLDRIGDEKFQRQYLGLTDDEKELVDKLISIAERHYEYGNIQGANSVTVAIKNVLSGSQQHRRV